MVGKTAIKDNSLKNKKNNYKKITYNLKKTLLKQNKIDNEFLEKLSFLTLEEIITLDVAISKAEKELGLSYRKKLHNNEGMLFYLNEGSQVSFHSQKIKLSFQQSFQ